jgi:methyl-accepting chemotaxis protein
VRLLIDHAKVGYTGGGKRGGEPAADAGPVVVDLTAEQFCLNCHVKAKVGDVLGSVKVGSYLDRKEAAWWTEVKLTAGALSLKILVHTILLFFLLKVRMAPLLSLRSTVSQLARGLMDLSPRAKVDGQDEFGELAQDLNHFLDRINVVVTDLDQILNKVVDASSRLGSLNRDLEQTVDVLREGASRAADGTMQEQAAQYRALAQTLREMALLEANMQNIAQSGQQVVHRLTHAEKPR